MNEESNSSNTTSHPGKNPPPPERRSAARFKIETSIEWRRQDESPSDWKPCTLIDLSVGGAGFTTAENIAAGEELKLRIAPPNSTENKRHITVSAKVVNTRQPAPGEFRYGVQFSQMFFLFAEWTKNSPPT